MCLLFFFQSFGIVEEERTKKNITLKTKRRDYTEYGDEGFKPGHEGMKGAVLAKYDEDMASQKLSSLCLSRRWFDDPLIVGLSFDGVAVKANRPTRQMQEEATIQVN